jgi:hypothetical protein
VNPTAVIEQIPTIIDQIDLELRRLVDSDEQFPFWD